jgi:primosomal protein N' (replication factor Y)
VLPARAGGGKQFDYLVKDAAGVAVGTEVRIDLAGRRVGGWVVKVGMEAPANRQLRPVAKVRGVGPEPSLVSLSEWAAKRWYGRRDALLQTASSPVAVRSLPLAALRPPARPDPASMAVALESLPASRLVLVRLPPAADPTGLIAGLAGRGPLLVVVPSLARALALARRLRRGGGDVAVVPEEWAQARAGSAVVVGSRAAAWAPCPGLASAVVVDGHDEALWQEQAPTWNAVDVVAERCLRAEAQCVVLSPCPGLALSATCELVRVEEDAERAGWASLRVVDLRSEDPRSGLYSEELVALLRSRRRVVCVLNRLGRFRLLVCTACGDVAACERCGGALSASGVGAVTTGVASQTGAATALFCRRCGLARPEVCARCGSQRLRHLRPGVSRVREELEMLARRPVAEVTAATREGVPAEALLVGTEALLWRLDGSDRVDAVVFLDFDQEMLAPRVRAGEEALGLLASASRAVGGHRGLVLVQTRTPDHPVLAAAAAGNPEILATHEEPVRQALRWPPFSSVAIISGPAAAEFASALTSSAGGAVEVLGPSPEGRFLVKAGSATALSEALWSAPRPAERLRVEVQPARY